MKCNICGEDFKERKDFPGLKVCEICDATGKSGILKRGNIQVFMGGKRGL